jgi:DNA polymerase III delta prime subunit
MIFKDSSMTFAPDLYIHDTSRRHIERYIAQPAHAVLLHGAVGVGATTIAWSMAHAMGDTMPLVVESIEGKDISIEQIRELYTLTRGAHHDTQAVIIDDSHRLSAPAQHAFLKLLEEPPENTYFILVAYEPHLLLPTIHSRVQAIELQRLPANKTASLLHERVPDEATRRQLQFIASGLPAQILRLNNDADELATSFARARSAKAFVEATTYDRLILLQQFIKDREQAIAFVEMIGLIVERSSIRQPQLTPKLAILSRCLDRLHDNAHVRLQLMSLALSL